MEKKQVNFWVHPSFKQKIKLSATKLNMKIVDFTEKVGKGEIHFDFEPKVRKKKCNVFKNGFDLL